VFGLKYYAKLSTMPDEHLGDEELWDKATESIKRALETNGMKYEIKEKEGAFYGPKIDFDIEDSQGRLWQCATIQLDYQLPKRFGIVYTGEDGKEHTPGYNTPRHSRLNREVRRDTGRALSGKTAAMAVPCPGACDIHI
jgi:Ser-tRNA(Thr) hydrolase (EC 3.1.1.-)